MNDYKNHPLVKGYVDSNNFGKLLGMNFEIESPGNIEYRMKITENHLATPFASHGGAISALMDASMGVCALSEVLQDNKVVSTIELKISFLSPALLEDELIATSKIIKRGKRLLFVEGRIVNQDEKVIAFGTGTFNAYPAERAGFS